MQKHGDSLLLSATDLVGHLNCQHLTGLDIAVANGTLARPASWDPLLELLWERGAEHERGFVAHLEAQGLAITVIDGIGTDDAAVAKTLSAMQAGDPIIIQGAFRVSGWVGRTDVLRRVESPSALGAWSYEVIDTKLARETKAGTVLQLCLYAALVDAVQERRPEYCYVVAPWSGYEPQAYRMDDYAAYYRRVRHALESAIIPGGAADIYPEPKEHCDVCRWRARCDDRRREDDHLSLVAGIAKTQISELATQGVTTLAGLAVMPLPLRWKPTRGSQQAYERIGHQARLQLAGREAGAVLHELLPVSDGFGLTTLPEPSAGDIFLDLEGDPFAGEGGLEYLFGYSYAGGDGQPVNVADWALTRDAEKEIFERFVDFVSERLKVYPDLHVYHFAPYEPAALKRLMGRYATREAEIDGFLRSRRLVDLYSVVRQGLRASVESYSIKKLEPLYGYVRTTPLPEANKALAKIQAGLELGDLDLIDDEARVTVARYNQDDCRSTHALRDWLEAQRAAVIAQGVSVPRPTPPEAAPGEALTDWQLKIAELIARLTADVPIDKLERTPEQHARWLLAHTLDWHRREQKAVWWEYFRLSGLATDDLLEERAGLSGLNFVGPQGGSSKAPIHRYTFPPQETEIRGGEDLNNLGGTKLGSVHEISLEGCWVDIKKRMDSASVHPEAVFSHKVVNADVLADALVRIGESVAAQGMEGPGPFLAARDLLLRNAPRVGGQAVQHDGELALDAARRLALASEGGVLPIQGPPGSGKTFTGARMICALVQAGRKVGICATSHKVIRNLLDEVVLASIEEGVALCCIQKPAEPVENQARLRFAKKSADLFAALSADVQVAGGTAWVWSSPDAVESGDRLFLQ